MKRMLKEERALRKYCNDVCSRGDIPGVIQQAVFSGMITDITRAVREECAKVASINCHHSTPTGDDGLCRECEAIAAAIREGK